MTALFVSLAWLACGVARADYGTQEFNASDAFPGLSGELGMAGGDAAVVAEGDRGEVRIYRRGALRYTKVQTLDGDDDAGWADADTPPDAGGLVFDSYGEALATDDTWIIAGDPLGDDGHGRYYVYSKSGSSWQLYDLIDHPMGPGGPGGFGWEASVGDRTAALGGTDHMYVYRWYAVPIGGGVYAFDWVYQTELSLPRDEDRFTSVAAYGDRIVVGSVPPDTLGVEPAVYVFERSGTSWPLVETLEVAGTAVGDDYGIAVAIEGNLVAVGAPRTGPGDDGMVHVFYRGSTGWNLYQSIGSPDIITAGDFGRAVAISGDQIAIGDPGRYTYGAVMLYDFGLISYVFIEELTPTSPRFGSHLGRTVDIDDGVILGGNQTEGYHGNAQIFYETLGIIPP
jgi:hypothetical protein